MTLGKKQILFQIIKKVFKTLLLLGGIGFIYLLFYQRFEIGIPCIFHKLTGLLCPGCGMTRAMAALSHGDFAAALQHNALSITLLPVLCLYLLYRFILGETKKRSGYHIWEYVLLTVFFVVVVGYGIIRNL